VPKRETDIILIRKYLNGELDTRAMHQLEKRAQDDPFLMDAIEGYEKAGSDQQPNLDELAGRLQQRIARGERRIIPFKFIAAAASILAVLTISGLWLYRSRPEKTKIAQVTPAEIKIKPVLPPQSGTAKPNAVKPDEMAALKPGRRPVHLKKSAVVYNKITAAPSPVIVADQIASISDKSKAKEQKDTVPLNEVIVMGYTNQKKKDVTASVTTVSPGVERLLQGRAAGVMIRGTGTNNVQVPKKTIKGQIVGKDDGLPIVGATVRVQGTNASAVTDANGMFNLSADSNKSKLIVAYIGYTARQVNIRQRDSLNTIALEPANAALAEVVVTGYTNPAATDNTAVMNAHPRAGWSSFKKYLKQNAVSPDGKTGVVKLSFDVDRAGAINNMFILKSLSPAADQKAIELVKSGQGWAGSSTGKPEKVKVRVKFIK
jgi:TonB family protein